MPGFVEPSAYCSAKALKHLPSGAQAVATTPWSDAVPYPELTESPVTMETLLIAETALELHVSEGS